MCLLKLVRRECLPVRLIGRLEIHELGMFAPFTRKMHGNDTRLFPSVGAGSKYTSLASGIHRIDA